LKPPDGNWISPNGALICLISGTYEITSVTCVDSTASSPASTFRVIRFYS
jgi:hypothetical protein